MTSSLHCVTCVDAMEQNMGMSLGCVCFLFSHEHVDASCVPVLWRYGFKRWAGG